VGVNISDERLKSVSGRSVVSCQIFLDLFQDGHCADLLCRLSINFYYPFNKSGSLEGRFKVKSVSNSNVKALGHQIHYPT